MHFYNMSDICDTPYIFKRLQHYEIVLGYFLRKVKTFVARTEKSHARELLDDNNDN